MSKFVFQEEKTEQVPKPSNDKTWRILVVDDDESVHQVTKLVLLDATIENRPLDIVSVYSSVQAKEILQNDSSFCMAFIDVVMETDHAGLELVEWIRKDLKNQTIRLVLRTGQAGTAPESSVIRDFDINDYKDKTDFTAGKMTTTVYASIRAYRDIVTIKRSLDGFKNLIKSTHDLLKISQFRPFGSAALDHLLTLMDLDSSALYIARSQTDFDNDTQNRIIACTGKYTSESDSLEKSDISEEVKKLIQQAFIDKTHYTDESCFVGFYQTSPKSSSVLYIEFQDDADHFRSSFAELFATNVAMILENVNKQHEVESTQKDLLNIVGEAIESRSKETGYHVQRVAQMCELLAQKYGLDEEFVHAIRLASPLHDIGKLIIPEHILSNPGKLSDEDWQLMKTHALAGSQLLSQSSALISKVAARLAHYHHENWDGSGYPDGLCGESIPIEARIMAVADVFDSLGSKRCYKPAWDEEEIKAFFNENKGVKFEPQLVDILFENYDEFSAMRTVKNR